MRPDHLRFSEVGVPLESLGCPSSTPFEINGLILLDRWMIEGMNLKGPKGVTTVSDPVIPAVGFLEADSHEDFPVNAFFFPYFLNDREGWIGNGWLCGATIRASLPICMYGHRNGLIPTFRGACVLLNRNLLRNHSRVDKLPLSSILIPVVDCDANDQDESWDKEQFLGHRPEPCIKHEADTISILFQIFKRFFVFHRVDSSPTYPVYLVTGSSRFFRVVVIPIGRFLLFLAPESIRERLCWHRVLCLLDGEIPPNVEIISCYGCLDFLCCHLHKVL